MMNDLISKYAAINALCNNCENNEEVCAYYPCEQYIAIEKLPHFGWRTIDHNPTTTGLYLVVCNELGKARRRICAYYHETEKWLENGKNITKYVTYWMPLPTPPMEERNEEIERIGTN